MGRAELPSALVLATSNPGKRAEWELLLAEQGVARIAAPDLPEPVEDGGTCLANAALKASAAAAMTGAPCLADDVGLEVDALGGAPGAEVRPWAEALGGWEAARRTLGARAAGSGATYRCALALAWPDGRVVQAEGAVRGRIVAARGPGPGLEPCFVPDGADAPLGALPPDTRRRLHHRPRAWEALLATLRGPGGRVKEPGKSEGA